MKIVVFGLTISSSWGNGHATLWRSLSKGLAALGHEVVFFERDVPYYASHRDLTEVPGCRLILYRDWNEVRNRAQEEIGCAEVAMVTSYCPDAIAATERVLDGRAELRVFYDLDTPVTLLALENGKSVDYIGPSGLADFDVVLSYTGGSALEGLRSVLGARQVVPIYGSVDPDVHRPTAPAEEFRCDMSYLGTFAADRQQALTSFLIEPARRIPSMKFLIGGAQYPQSFPWNPNIFFAAHVSPPQHPAFYCSSRLTLNITRGAMARMGYCPSGRLFEAAACGVPIITDSWQGLDEFFRPGQEIIVVQNTEEAITALKMYPAELARIGTAARERALMEHTGEKRAAEMEASFAEALSRKIEPVRQKAA